MSILLFEQEIQDRIEQGLTQDAITASIMHQSEVNERNARKLPAILISYAGLTPISSVPKKQTFDVDFYIVIVVSSGKQDGGRALREQADPIITSVLSSLIGFRLSSGSQIEVSAGGTPEFEKNLGVFSFQVKAKAHIAGKN